MRKVFLGFALAMLGGAVIASFSLAGDGDEGQSAESDAYMKQYMESIAPNEHHKALEKRVGSWNAVLKLYPAPGADPMISTATCVNTMVLGDRFLESQVEGTVMGMPFVGIGISGFDKTSGKHTTYWIDSMGTQSVFAEGVCSDMCTKEEYMFTTTDPMSGVEKSIRTVTTVSSDSEYVYEWYEQGPDGNAMKTMEIVYTRVGS